MKAFITGGSGFIGTFVAQKLSRNNVEVTIFDKRSPSPESLSLCKYIQGDLLDLEKIKEAISGHDVVYHLAANADISMGVKDTALDLQLTTIATYNVLESMRLGGVSSIVFLSGSGVYGDIGEFQGVETAGPLLPISLYGASKLAAEGLISAFSNMFNMQAVILRPANVVGGGQTHGVLFDFIQKLKRDCHHLEILGDGNQTKSYLHIDDLYQAIATVLKTKQERVSLVNVASADTVNVNWIAKKVIEFLNLRDVQITHTHGKVGWIGDVPTIRLNTEKLRELGWTPKYSSEEAIDKALAEILTA
ncbi:NAD-dependent epimerase/dehydratase family protein [soil metagenome]